MTRIQKEISTVLIIKILLILLLWWMFFSKPVVVHDLPFLTTLPEELQ